MSANRLRDQSQPELFVDELTLRPWQPSDAPAVVRAYQDAAIQRWHVRTMTDDEAAEWVASWSRQWTAETGAGWAVCDDDGLLARMSLRALDLAEGLGKVGYWVLPEARGRRDRLSTRPSASPSPVVRGDAAVRVTGRSISAAFIVPP